MRDFLLQAYVETMIHCAIEMKIRNAMMDGW